LKGYVDPIKDNIGMIDGVLKGEIPLEVYLKRDKAFTDYFMKLIRGENNGDASM